MEKSPERVAGYEILTNLGRTGWGDNYRARQVSLDREVRLTLLPPEDEAPEIHARATRCATLTHPHLVSGIDFGREEGRSYLVIEWADGFNSVHVTSDNALVCEIRLY